MSETIITTIITVLGSGIVTLAVCLISNSKSQALIDYRLTKLEEKIDSWTNFEVRISTLETKVHILEEEKHDQ